MVCHGIKVATIHSGYNRSRKGGGKLLIWYREVNKRGVEVGGERKIRNHPGTHENNHLGTHVNYQAVEVIF